MALLDSLHHPLQLLTDKKIRKSQLTYGQKYPQLKTHLWIKISASHNSLTDKNIRKLQLTYG